MSLSYLGAYYRCVKRYEQIKDQLAAEGIDDPLCWLDYYGLTREPPTSNPEPKPMQSFAELMDAASTGARRR